MKEPIKVLVLDDSLLFREVLARGISSDAQIKVVAKAADAFEARNKILEFQPDVITCDVEMPKMNGIEFIRRLLPQYPLPVIVVSAVSEAVFDAMNAGAVDFVVKPNIQSPGGVEAFIRDLIVKIKGAARARVIQQSIEKVNMIRPEGLTDTNQIIAIGASTGGTEAIFNILKGLTGSMPGIVITQHIPPVFSKMFADRLNDQTGFTVKEGTTGDYIEPGKVFIAPGDQHMTIRKIAGRYKIVTAPGEKVNGHCPSVDVLFESVAKECGTNAIGVILTGMGYDGAKGLMAMRRAGAKTIGQDEASCVVYGMPKVAFEIGAVQKQMPLNKIPQALCTMIKKV